MRKLEGQEQTEAISMLEEALKVAMRSSCAKSHRGVVCVVDGEIVSSAYNGPPPGFRCNPAYCNTPQTFKNKTISNPCTDHSEHAEMAALFAALRFGLRNGRTSIDRMYHIKEKDGNMVPATEPSCMHCSKEMLMAGVKEFVLLQKEGIFVYDMIDYHARSLAYHFGEGFVENVLTWREPKSDS